MSRDDGCAPASALQFLPDQFKKHPIEKIKTNGVAPPCRLEELNSIKQLKPYVHFNSSVLTQLLREKSISHAAKLIWVALWDQATFSDNKEIIISIRGLSKKVNMAPSTIQKCLIELEENSFILKKTNQIKTNSGTSQYFLRLPSSYIKIAHNEASTRKS